MVLKVETKIYLDFYPNSKGQHLCYRAFDEPPNAKPRMRRSCPSGWIGNKECGRLITGASRILASSVSIYNMVSIRDRLL